jgi:hypothetical protein
MFHGSPFSGVSTFDGWRAPIFFTQSERVAREYAGNTILGAQQHPSGQVRRSPTLYIVDVDPGRDFDMRRQADRYLYQQLRMDAITTSDDPDIRTELPKLGAEGFIMRRTGLPGFSFWRPIRKLLHDAGYSIDSIWLDEGSQGVSLAHFKPSLVSLISSSALNEGTVFTGQSFSDATGEWDIQTLIDVARSPNVVDIPIGKLEHNLDPSPGETTDELPGSEEFVARADKADLRYPIIVISYPDGLWIADGVHRLWKAKHLGKRSIRGYIISHEILFSLPQSKKDD